MSTTTPASPAAAESRFVAARRLALVALAYAFTLKLALFFPDAQGILAAVWPPGGVALAALLLNPPRRWRSILVVVFLTGNVVNLLSGRPGLASVGFMLANVLESWGCAWVMTRFAAGRQVTFTRIGEVMALGLCAVVVNGVTALLGAASAELASKTSFQEFYLGWWIADGLGILLVTPMIIACVQPWPRTTGNWWRLPELLALALVWCIFATLGFLGAASGLPLVPRPYWIFIPLLWSALRIGARGTSVLLAILTVIAIGLTTTGKGEFPLGGRDLAERLHMVQLFLGVVALTGLAVAAVVAERRQAEASRRESGAHYRSILDTMNGFAYCQMHFVGDRPHDFSYLEVNRAFGILTGLKDVVGKRVTEVIPGIRESDPQLFEIYGRVARTGKPEQFEIHMKSLGNWFRVSVWSPQQEHFVAVFDVISAQKKAEAALLRSQERYELIESAVQDGLWDWNILTGEEYFSPRWLEIAGYRIGELPGHKSTFLKLVHPDDLALVTEVTREHLQVGKAYQVEFRLQHKNGGHRWVYSRGKAMRDSSGQPVRMVGSISDITERKQDEEHINKLANELSVIMETIPLGVAFIQDRRIRAANPALDQIFGYASGATIGCETVGLYADSDAHARIGQEGYAALARNEVFHTEAEMRRQDGSHFMCNLTGRAIDPQNLATGSIWLVEDITKRKQAEAEQAQLEALNQQLQKSESLGRMAGAIAHNFNNRLQPVMIGLEMAIQDHLVNGSPDPNLVEALQSASSAAEISQRMLVYLGQIQAKPEHLDLAELCQQSLPILLAALPKTLGLKSVLPAPGPLIYADGNQIQQVLTNLLTNAWEACQGHAGDLRLAVNQVSAADLPTTHRFPVDWHPQATTYAFLEVTDNGCGIAAVDLGKLFDPFYSTKFAGRGLGLSVALGIVKKWSGCITVASEPDRGSVFRVFLPVAKTETPPAVTKILPPLEKSGRGMVLVVDDDAAVRKFVAVALRRVGYAMIVAADGAEALALFERHREEIGCVLCDLTMPKLDGWGTLAGLRRLAPGFPVIMASGYNESRVMADHHDELPQAYLQKPFEMEAVIKTITSLINHR